MIPEGIILIWPGENGSIPTGWERVTSLDGKYPKAWGTQSPNTSGGSNTHSHTANSHGHDMNSHSHTVTTQHNWSPSEFSNRADNCIDNHDHGTFSVAGKSGGSLASEVKTWSSNNRNRQCYGRCN